MHRSGVDQIRIAFLGLFWAFGTAQKPLRRGKTGGGEKEGVQAVFACGEEEAIPVRLKGYVGAV